jgi:SAM-dependent methyltransferase
MTAARWFVDHYDEIFPYRPATLAFLATRLPGAGRVLDIGCGPGRYAARLQETGRHVLGIDVDPGMIARARREHCDPEFRVLAMSDLDELADALDGAGGGGFTGALALGNVMAFLSPDGWPRFLAALARLLAPGGVWLFQTVNFDPLLGKSQHTLPPLTLDGGVTVERTYSARPDGSFDFRIDRVVGDARETVAASRIYPRAAADYRRVHEGVGFVLCDQLGDFAGTPFDSGHSGANIQVWRVE